MRNIPGVETAHVDRLNLLRLAPGGSFGRFIIWTEGAFKRLSEIYGTAKGGAPMKSGYHLPRASMQNADLARIINSTEVQSVLKPKIEPPTSSKKANALKNKAGTRTLPWHNHVAVCHISTALMLEAAASISIQVSSTHHKYLKLDVF